MCVFLIINYFGQILTPSVKQRTGKWVVIGGGKFYPAACVCMCVWTNQMDPETVDVEKYGGCKKQCVCVYLNRTTDVQGSKSVKAVYLIVKDTFNYNSRGSSVRVLACEMVVAD